MIGTIPMRLVNLSLTSYRCNVQQQEDDMKIKGTQIEYNTPTALLMALTQHQSGSFETLTVTGKNRLVVLKLADFNGGITTIEIDARFKEADDDDEYEFVIRGADEESFGH